MDQADEGAGAAVEKVTLACPSCNGRGGNTCFVDGRNSDGSHYGDIREIECTVCGGQGRISEEKAEQIRIGKMMRDARVSAHISLKEAAQVLGVGPAELSKIERGEVANAKVTAPTPAQPEQKLETNPVSTEGNS